MEKNIHKILTRKTIYDDIACINPENDDRSAQEYATRYPLDRNGPWMKAKDYSVKEWFGEVKR